MERTTTMPGWGRTIRRVTLPEPGPVPRERRGWLALRVYRLRTGDSVPSVASLRTSASSPSFPIMTFADMQQGHLAKPRMPRVSTIDGALDKCRKVLDHSRKRGFDKMPAGDVHRAVAKESAFSAEAYENRRLDRTDFTSQSRLWKKRRWLIQKNDCT